MRPSRESVLELGPLLARLGRGEFPPTLYLEGPDEAVKAVFLAELRHAWARACPEAPVARVFRAAESGVDEILAAYQGSSLFSPRELAIVLEVEDLGRSERKIAAFAEGLVRPAGGSTLVLVESAAESPRRALEPLRAACRVRASALPLGRAGLLEWGARRLLRENVTTDRGVLEALADATENDPSSFFNELEKLITTAGSGGRVAAQHVDALLKPVIGAELPDYLSAVALGDPGLAAQRLGRLLASGVGEGTVLFALANLIGGALGGWSRFRGPSDALRRRCSPRGLVARLDAVYRAEAAWKLGRADSIAALEHATRTVAAAA